MKLAAKIGLATALLLSLSLLLCAEPVSQLRPTNYVNDFAGVLDPNTVAQLNSICQQVDEKAHAQIAVVTVKTLDGSDIESYAVALFKQWGIGAKATDHGVLILLATQDRRYRIEVGYGLEPILPDGKTGGFGREAVPLLKQNDYNGAVSLLTMRVADVIAQDAGVQLTGARPRAPTVRQEPDKGLSVVGIIVLVVIFLILVSTPFGRLLLFSMLLGGRGGGGGYGGGGFGSGGGGFGGFGGGGSGGGGASGSW
ncbi:MAG TPA: TPM domain-containing protein [Terriglobales bacterium]|nr:TPM domain-containing protein [Terriglobales bacterium]